MSTQGFETPKIRSILIAILAFTFLLIFIFRFLPDTVKLVGAPFLFIPEKLGIVEPITPQEIHNLSLKTSPTLLSIRRPGKYAVFTDDYDLLMMTSILEDEKAPAWLKVRSQTTGEHVALANVDRGLRMYDTYLAKGRPIYTFDIFTPGLYEFIYPTRDASISLAPDYTTGKEKALLIAYTLQIMVVVILVGALPGLRYWRRIQRLKALQNQYLARSEELWRRVNQKKG